MSFFTAFVSAIHSAWGDNVTDPLLSHSAQQSICPAQYNVLTHKMEQFELDSAASRTVSFANYASSEWTFLVMRVVGKAYFNIAGFDTDGVTAITSKIPAYGTALLPGIAMISSYNVTSISVVSEQDDTTVELYAAISCADNDARLA